MALLLLVILFMIFTENNKINPDYDLSIVEDKKISFVEDLANDDLALKVHTFLHSMKEPYKEAFNLRVFGELDYKSIGQILAKPIPGPGSLFTGPRT